MVLDPFLFHLKTNLRKQEWVVINLCVRINIRNPKDVWEIIPISWYPILVILFLYVL